ncbi:ApeA N-terminal domain 1-containing protein [Pseudomonas sp. Z2-11]
MSDLERRNSDLIKGNIMRKKTNKWSGYFWLPNDTKKKIPGTLTIEDDGSIQLELIGHFQDLGEDIDESRINGEVEELGLVTLDQCFYTSKPILLSEVQKAYLISNQAIIGAAYDRGEPLEFNAATFEIDNLDEWVGITGLVYSRQDTAHSHRIEFSLPDKIEYNLSNGMTLKIGFGYKIPSPSVSKVSIQQNTYLRLSSTEPRPLEDFMACAFKLNNLLSLAMNQSMTMRSFILNHDDLNYDYGNETIVPIALKLIYRAANYKKKSSKLHWREMLFNHRKIEESAEGYLNNWLNLYDVCEPALNLFFSTLNEPNTFSESKFLALAQSLETLHRRTSDKTLMPADQYAKFSDNLLEVTPETAREWLKNKIKFGNEITFKQRLLDLTEPFQSLLGGAKRRKSISHKIVTSRNYYTHYNPDLEKDAQKDVNLLNLTYTMEALCKLIYLQKLGFSVENIEKMITYSLKQALQAESRSNL